MSDAERVVVYVPAADARALRAEGEDVAKWVRELMREVFAKRRAARVAI